MQLLGSPTSLTLSNIKRRFLVCGPVLVNPKELNLTFDTGFTLGGMSDSLYE